MVKEKCGAAFYSAVPLRTQIGLKLPPLAVVLLAVVAQPIIASTGLTFPLRNVTARRTRVVVVVDAMRWLLLYFVDGMKRLYLGHVVRPRGVEPQMYSFDSCRNRGRTDRIASLHNPTSIGRLTGVGAARPRQLSDLNPVLLNCLPLSARNQNSGTNTRF